MAHQGQRHIDQSYPLASPEEADRIRRVPYDFSAQVAPSTTVTLEREVEADGTIERITVRFYQGPELAVRVRPYVRRREELRPLIRFNSGAGAKAYLDGEDDAYDIQLREPVFKRTRDTIVIEMQNTSAQYAYDIRCQVEVDYAKGVYPVLALP